MRANLPDGVRCPLYADGKAHVRRLHKRNAADH